MLGPGVAEVVMTSGISVNWLKLDWSSASHCRTVALSGTVDEEGRDCPSAELEEPLRLYDVGPVSGTSSTLLELLRRPLPKSDRADERDDRLDGGDMDNCEVWEEGPDGCRLSCGRENSEEVVVRLARSSRDALVDLDCDRETSYCVGTDVVESRSTASGRSDSAMLVFGLSILKILDAFFLSRPLEPLVGVSEPGRPARTSFSPRDFLLPVFAGFAFRVSFRARPLFRAIPISRKLSYPVSGSLSPRVYPAIVLVD